MDSENRAYLLTFLNTVYINISKQSYNIYIFAASL